jgi:Tol biopolymer transport system component/tRNA A-37 threonylcarbamoyl transferase component Bud32
MGEVYRARDTRLGREVAIKVLPGHLSDDPVRKQRFEREARAISGLNHPNICVLHDVGHQDGIDYLVMEYIEGDTLAKRLERGPLSVEQVEKLGREIAEALDRAHCAGIIHRDLKPGNIILTKTGAKLLDFGLARPTSDAGAMATTVTAASPAESSMTEQGTILGTFRYMSPEQIEGKELDGRSDIFSLGAVLYEALTGEKAFPGKSQLSVASAILEKEPSPILGVKPMTPAVLDHAIRRCLAKDREERWQTARDLASELKWIGQVDPSSSMAVPERSPTKWSTLVAWALVAGLGVAVVVLAMGVGQRPERRRQVLRSTLLPPAGASFLPFNFAISPDGGRVAFVAMSAEGKMALWVRGLSSASALQLTGTEGATYPFWSPDSQQVGFFAAGRLKAVDLGNSTVRNICEAFQGFGASWNQDGVIVFAPGVTGPVYRVAASGGVPEAVTKSETGSAESHHWPYFLPDGKHFVFFVNWSLPSSQQKNGIYVASLDGRTPKLITEEVTGNVQYASGYLLYVRDRMVMAHPFDTERLETTGAAMPLTQQEVDKFLDFWQSSFSVSRDGKLLFTSATDAPSRLVWYDKTGSELGQFPEIGYAGPQFSPDGRYLAASADDEHNGKHFIRVYDFQRNLSWRVTEGGNESNPVWSPNGKSVAYRDATSKIAVVPVDGSGAARVIVSGVNVIPCDWSADGHLLYMSLGGGAYPSVEVFSLGDQKSVTLAKLGAEPQFSPDGKWVAYIGAPMRDIFVQKYPGPGPRLQVSTMPGSAQPRWSRDGKKIYFVQPDRKIMMVSFDGDKGAVGPPEVLVQTRVTVSSLGWFQYGVAPDGRLLVDSLPSNNSSPLTLILNWEEEVKKN